MKIMVFFSPSIRMSDFYKNKELFKIDAIDVNKILILKNEAHGKKN